MIEPVRGANSVILVTEPTPFGFHDLKLAVEMVRALRLPCGVLLRQSAPPAHLKSTPDTIRLG
jgi:MinD superfamily P-loop ATPase